MMLAIQALKDENEKLNSKLASQEERLMRQEDFIREIMSRLD